jgi:hypothetical protein
MKVCSPDQQVVPIIGSTNSLGLAAAHTRPRRRQNRDYELSSWLRWFPYSCVLHTSGER